MVSIFVYLIALTVSAFALMWFVGDNLRWGFEESFSVMAGVFVGCIFYGMYNDIVTEMRDNTSRRKKRERARSDFVEYNSKA